MRNYFDKDWIVSDITEEMGGTPAIEVRGYFDEFKEDDEVCSFFFNDINPMSQVENVSLVKHAPDMYRFLLKAEGFLPKDLRLEWIRIKKKLGEQFDIDELPLPVIEEEICDYNDSIETNNIPMEFLEINKVLSFYDISDVRFDYDDYEDETGILGFVLHSNELLVYVYIYVFMGEVIIRLKIIEKVKGFIYLNTGWLNKYITNNLELSSIILEAFQLAKDYIAKDSTVEFYDEVRRHYPMSTPSQEQQLKNLEYLMSYYYQIESRWILEL
ncbi:hypothetical protein [Lysinibacillus sp. LZ02]|uniref:hypothetical protein n=1 Tax=Lysinibacillus sp. LZ02 TaxID=3420668 RepID=UPI003D36BF02